MINIHSILIISMISILSIFSINMIIIRWIAKDKKARGETRRAGG